MRSAQRTRWLWTSGCAMRACGRRVSAWRSPICCFAKGDRHLSAEELHEEALAAGVPVSLATVYNALHQFTEAGSAAHPRCRRVEDLFRHQHSRSPPFLHRRREQGVRHRCRPGQGDQPAGTAGGHGDRQCRHRRAAAPQARPLNRSGMQCVDWAISARMRRR